MELKYLELLEDIAKTQSITASAQRLGYTQSGVSHIIKKLEKELGVTLLKRLNHGVQLSTEAKYLLPYIQATNAQYRNFQEALDAIHGVITGSITVGAYSSVAQNWLPRLITEFKKSYPYIQIHVREGYSDQILSWLREETIDFGFMSQVPEYNYEFIPFQKEPLYAVVPKDFEIPEHWQNKFPLSAFEHYPFIASEVGVDTDVSSLLRKEAIHPNIQCYCKEDKTIISLVESGLGITILPALMVAKETNIIKMELSKPYERTLGIYYAKPHLSLASQTFIKLAEEVLHQK